MAAQSPGNRVNNKTSRCPPSKPNTWLYQRPYAKPRTSDKRSRSWNNHQKPRSPFFATRKAPSRWRTRKQSDTKLNTSACATITYEKQSIKISSISSSFQLRNKQQTSSPRHSAQRSTKTPYSSCEWQITKKSTKNDSAPDIDQISIKSLLYVLISSLFISLRDKVAKCAKENTITARKTRKSTFSTLRPPTKHYAITTFLICLRVSYIGKEKGKKTGFVLY